MPEHSDPKHAAPNQPKRQDADDVDDTIDPENEVDEALFETFPASDPPGYTGGDATPSQDAAETRKATKKDRDGDA